ncbi:MAG: AAA family ATPase, partial [Mariniphaga sp.]
MKIQVKELGAIKEGTIDLSNKLNVFCGPNSTGKTYMAYLIYALTRLDNKSIGIALDEEYLKTFLSENIVTIKLDLENLWKFREKEFKNVKTNLWSLFSTPQEKAASFYHLTEIICLESKEDFDNKITTMEINKDVSIYNYDFNIFKSNDSLDVQIRNDGKNIKSKAFSQFMEIAFLSRLYSFIAFYPITTSIIFPVERNSIYTFSKELSIKRNEAVEHLESIASKKNVDLFDLYFKRSTRYPQPIRDILEVAEDLENTQKRISKFHDFALNIENELLKGKVVINKETGGVDFQCDKSPKNKLSFHQSSSIVKTLASLVIYLKYEANDNDLVLIDEPELNLHPDNQVKLARIFARLINNGLRLIISTHSDYIVREFNNLIMVS